MTRDAPTTPTTRGLFAAVIGTTIVGQLGLIFAPFLLPMAARQAHVDDILASRILSVEFAAWR